MHFSDAQQLMRLCGPVKYLLLGADMGSLAGELRQRGGHATDLPSLPDSQQRDIDCIVVESRWMLGHAHLEEAFATLYEVGARWVIVRFGEMDLRRPALPGPTRRTVWRAAAFASGFRRAPQSISVEQFQRDQSGLQIGAMLEFERIPQAAFARWPVVREDCGDGRHLDPARSNDPRSEALLARYALAASLVRPGDTVLDCFCGTGAGTAILAAQSAGGHFIGVDVDPAVVAYASANYGAAYEIGYSVPAAGSLACVADDTVDLIVALGTLEWQPEVDGFLKEARRVLKPDGRIVVSAPNLWVAPDGAPLQPGHTRVFDYASFRSALGRHFLVEERWAQSVTGGLRLPSGPRVFERLQIDESARDDEWMILVASVDPLDKASSRQYRHPGFSANADGSHALVAFGEHFVNPWLYRSMVQLGERIRDRDVLNDLAARAIMRYPANSADFGAALTVLGYALLEQPDNPLVSDVMALCADYRVQPTENPHVRRWQISGTYVAARLALVRGDREAAREMFAWVAEADFLSFSPLLATKVIASRFQLGVMSLAFGANADALKHFQEGVAACRKALGSDDGAAIGRPAQPLSFGFSELAEVADMGAQCATAINLLPVHARSPGLFWSKVDTKRFGVVSWAQALERENSDLRRRLGL